MIPAKNTVLTEEVTVSMQPSPQHWMDTTKKRITGMCDGKEALQQTIYKILNTERYKYVIYSWNYGVEFWDLIGKHPSYAKSEIERRITDALMQDDRITDVSDFSFEQSGRNSLLVSFTVNTIYGDIEETQEVTV